MTRPLGALRRAALSLALAEGTLRRYPATVTNVVDADTIDVNIDLGFRLHAFLRLRVAHVDAAEVSTPEGKAARDHVKELLPPGTAVVVFTQKPDKYGRALADVLIPDGRDLAAVVLALPGSKPYEGGTR